ncbi:MAG: 16S rRNA (cytosine(967)-C(5))-methyltransferase RsmB [Gammaproteobacteria bacterium]|nr:16S rRNA (cytosine(967)-C(5))-methyltransferase RsmB [Gammaproteobacteria bacterium]
MGGESLQTALQAGSAAGKDLPQVQAICFGTLRAFVRLDALLGLLRDRPLKARDRLLHALLLAGLFELDEGRTPDHAVVSETVSATQKLSLGHARGLVNAVLRRYLRERSSLEAKIDEQENVKLGQPLWLHEALVEDWPHHWRSIAEASNAHPPMWLRVNRRAGGVDEYLQALEKAGMSGAQRHAFVPDALRLEVPVPVSALPGFAEGKVSVQDAGAQIAAGLLAPKPGEKILDACSAPGGKAAHIAESCDCLCDILAVDISAERLERVHENSERLGLDCVATCEGDACAPEGWWDGEMFDRILLDVPCSATGVIRRHPDIRLLRRQSDIKTLAGRQRKMMRAIWPLLKPGGQLLYCTCSVLRSENEQVIDAFRKSETDVIVLPLPEAMPGIDAGDGRQILPGETDMDGFYYAYLEKKA